MDFTKALSLAKIDLMSKPSSVFFSTLCLNLKHIANDEQPTARTNGLTIEYNTNWFLALDREERLFVLLHEIMHVAHMHMFRGQGLDHKKFSIAADYVINNHLIEQGFKMPKGGLADTQYANMAAEEVYKLLPDMLPDPQDQIIYSQGNGDDKGDPVLKVEVENLVVMAAIQSEIAKDAIGTVPNDIRIYVNNLRTPPLPWNVLLSRYIQTKTKNDYSWSRPNRRYFPQHYLPSLYSESLTDIAVAVDTSGSVSDSDFEQIIAKVSTIFKMMNPENITLIQFDTEIHTVTRVKSIKELLGIKFSGRGGTNVTPVLDWANKHKPQVILVFTDGEFYKSPTKPKNTDVIWLIHNNESFKCDFGKIVYYKME